jgi:hypothetical protein
MHTTSTLNANPECYNESVTKGCENVTLSCFCTVYSTHYSRLWKWSIAMSSQEGCRFNRAGYSSIEHCATWQSSYMLGIMHADLEVLPNMTFWLKDGCTYHVRDLQVQRSFLQHNRTLSTIVKIFEIMDTDMGSFQHMAFCLNDEGMEDIMSRHKRETSA